MSATARLLLALAIALVGIGLGALLAEQYYAPQLADANKRIGELAAANSSLVTAAGRQNAVIDAEHAAGETRRAAAVTAAQQAHAAAQTHYDKGGIILGIRTPPGADACAAAREAFDAELREERQR